jgi:hypothetical protein
LRYRCIMKRPFILYQDFWPCDLDLEHVTLILNFDLVLKNCNLGYIFWTKCVGALILEIQIIKSLFLWYQDFWPCDVYLKLWPLSGSHFPASYVVYWQLLFFDVSFHGLLYKKMKISTNFQANILEKAWLIFWCRS